MIAAPSMARLPHTRLYRDSSDAQIVYVDLLDPAPVRGASAASWVPIPGSVAYLAGEVRFGPGAEGFGDVPQLIPAQRLLPMPWQVVPVFVWYREGDGVQVIARGKTSGFGSSNAVFNGTAPLSAMISPVLVSAELVCQARLGRVQVSGNGRPQAFKQGLLTAPLGERAAWDAPLGEALLEMLTRLVDSTDLVLDIHVGDEQPGGAVEAQSAELRQMAMLEWAHRLLAQIAPELTLGAPAALVRAGDLPVLRDLTMAWTAGSMVAMRAFRVWRPVLR